MKSDGTWRIRAAIECVACLCCSFYYSRHPFITRLVRLPHRLLGCCFEARCPVAIRCFWRHATYSSILLQDTVLSSLQGLLHPDFISATRSGWKSIRLPAASCFADDDPGIIAAPDFLVKSDSPTYQLSLRPTAYLLTQRSLGLRRFLSHTATYGFNQQLSG